MTHEEDVTEAENKRRRTVEERLIHGEEERSDLEKDLTDVLNKHSAENDSDTPDYILAKYLIRCLAAYNSAVKERGTHVMFANSSIDYGELVYPDGKVETYRTPSKQQNVYRR